MLQEEKFSINASDEDILETFAVWFKEANSYHDEMLHDQEIAEQYYLGNQTNRDLIPEYQSNTVENRIFEAVETLVPIATANVFHFTCKPGSENEDSVQRADKLRKVLQNKYRTLSMQEKLEQVVREMLLYKFGVLEYFWNKRTDDLDVQVVDPRLILIPKLRTDPHNLPYVIKLLEFTRDEFEEEFPSTEVDEMIISSNVDLKKKGAEEKKTIKVFEIWTNDTVAWIGGGQVINKIKNPYFDFTGDEQNGETIFRNHLNQPEKPFVFFTAFKASNTPVAAKSLVDITIPIQDAINTQKRRIIDNLRTMGNGQILIDSDAMSEEQASNLTNEPGLIIRGEGVASENKMRREAGVPLPGAHFSNLQHSEAVFDNIMGTHSATRGSAQAKTLGQDILSRQQDYTRVDLITRVLNRGVERMANGLVQLMKMFYTEMHTIKIIGEEETLEFVRLNQDDIENFIEIEVKAEQTLPMDEISQRTEAVQLWQLGALDPVTLFQRLKFTNPEKAAERLVLWKQGQLDRETVARITEASAGAEAKASASPDKGRGVETSANVMQRAGQSLGGTAPVGNAPKMAGERQQ